SVLFDDADQQDDADEGDQRQFGVENLQRQQRAQPGGGEGGDDRQRMGKAFVQNAKHDVDGDQRGDDQERLGTDRHPIGARVASILGVQRVRNVQLRYRLINLSRRLLDGDVLA